MNMASSYQRDSVTEGRHVGIRQLHTPPARGPYASETKRLRSLDRASVQEGWLVCAEGDASVRTRYLHRKLHTQHLRVE